MRKRKIFNSLVSVGTYEGFIEKIFRLANAKIPSYVCFANVHMIVEGYRDQSFQKIINEANVVAPDGKPLSIFLRLFEGVKQDRVCGMDIFPDILRQAEATDNSVYFYGTTDELLKQVTQKAQADFPKLQIAGYYAPPFRSLTKEEDDEIINNINRSNADLVFVSLGCPKQERWMAEHKYKIKACMLGLGQAFKVYAGVETRLPKWMRNFSIEWIYRLCLEPKRLWKRYLYTNSYFLLLVAQYILNRFSEGLMQTTDKRLNKPSMPHARHL